MHVVSGYVLVADIGVISCAGLPEGFAAKDVDDEDDEAGQIQEGGNDFKATGYRGPVPSNSEHRYELHLYALDSKLKVPKKVSMLKHIIQTSPLSLQRCR